MKDVLSGLYGKYCDLFLVIRLFFIICGLVNLLLIADYPVDAFMMSISIHSSYPGQGGGGTGVYPGNAVCERGTHPGQDARTS